MTLSFSLCYNLSLSYGAPWEMCQDMAMRSSECGGVVEGSLFLTAILKSEGPYPFGQGHLFQFMLARGTNHLCWWLFKQPASINSFGNHDRKSINNYKIANNINKLLNLLIQDL